MAIDEEDNRLAQAVYDAVEALNNLQQEAATHGLHIKLSTLAKHTLGTGHFDWLTAEVVRPIPAEA